MASRYFSLSALFAGPILIQRGGFRSAAAIVFFLLKEFRDQLLRRGKSFIHTEAVRQPGLDREQLIGCRKGRIGLRLREDFLVGVGGLAEEVGGVAAARVGFAERRVGLAAPSSDVPTE